MDQAVQPEPHGGIADAVGAGEFLHGTGSQDEPLDEGQVLVLQRIDPARSLGSAGAGFGGGRLRTGQLREAFRVRVRSYV
jgi:hypothetical protein